MSCFSQEFGKKKLAAPFGWVEQFDPKDGAVQKKDAMLAMRSSVVCLFSVIFLRAE